MFEGCFGASDRCQGVYGVSEVYWGMAGSVGIQGLEGV